MNWDRFWDLMEEPCFFSSGNQVVRRRKTNDSDIWEVIPVEALAEYNRLLENMQRMGTDDLSRLKQIVRK